MAKDERSSKDILLELKSKSKVCHPTFDVAIRVLGDVIDAEKEENEMTAKDFAIFLKMLYRLLKKKLAPALAHVIETVVEPRLDNEEKYNYKELFELHGLM